MLKTSQFLVVNIRLSCFLGIVVSDKISVSMWDLEFQALDGKSRHHSTHAFVSAARINSRGDLGLSASCLLLCSMQKPKINTSCNSFGMPSIAAESNCSGTLSRYWPELDHISCSHCPFGFYNSDTFLPQSQHFVSVHLEYEPADHGLNHCTAASLFVLARVSSLPHLKGGIVTA